jgi:hypothetical protein
MHLSIGEEASDIVQDILERLGAMTSLREVRLDAHQTSFQPRHFLALSNLLRSTTSLISLTLAGGHLGRPAAEFLVEGLSSNATLTQLCLLACRMTAREAHQPATGTTGVQLVSFAETSCVARSKWYTRAGTGLFAHLFYLTNFAYVTRESM